MSCQNFTSVTLVMVNYINFSSCHFIIHVFKSKEFFLRKYFKEFFCTKTQPTTLENFVVVVCAFLVGNQVKLNLMRSRKSRKGTAGEFPSTILLLWLIRPNPKFCLGFFFDDEHIFVKSEEVFLEISKYFSLVMALLRYFDEKKYIEI